MKDDVFVHMDTLSKLYFDNSRFHNDIHREALDETYPLFSQPGQALSEQVQPEQDSDTSARNELTELQKKAIEIAKRYEKLPMEERLSVIAQTFGCKTGKIETSPCTGKWRGTSDISIRFDNGVSLFIGNSRTPQAKTARVQNEYINSALVSYNPEIVSLTKEAALPILRKREVKDTLIQPKQLPDEPRDPLAPAYKVGDTVYLDDKEFAITEIGLHDVYLQSLTPAEQISRSKDKTIFENLLRQDERNKFITDFFSANLKWSNGDLCEVLTSEYGFFSQEEKDEISSWLRSGETNSQISEKMREQFSYRSDSMELSDVRADHDSSWEGLTIFLVDPAPNEDEDYPKDIISASWDEITELVRAMYQQELGGFRHEPVPEHNTPQSTRYIVVSDEYGEKDRPFTIWDSWNRLHYAEVGDTVNSFGTREEAQTYDRRGLNAIRALPYILHTAAIASSHRFYGI